MGINESKLPSQQEAVEGITTVLGRNEEINPYLEKLKELVIATPILKSPLADSSLKDFLVRRSLSQRHAGALDPTTTVQLLTLYQEWQRVAAQKVTKNQDDLGNKIEVVEALAMKLLQRLNYSVSVMKASAIHLEDVHALKVEVGEMKGKLKEVLENYETLCKKINAEGPDFLKPNVRPFSALTFSANDLFNKRENFPLQVSSIQRGVPLEM